jgi:two-component system cell cycle sensor histidine kinase/response regulator CckA
MSEGALSCEELRERLAQAEATLDALRRGEVDVVLGTSAPLVVRLKALMDENERLSREWQATFDAMQEAILLLDAEQRVLRANQAAARCFGHSPEEMADKPCWEIVHATDAPIPDCPLARMRESLRPERSEVPIGERWYEASVSPLFEGERLLGAVHVFTDITGRRRMTAALRESEERFRHITGIISDYAYAFEVALDGSLHARWVSDSFTRVFGFTRREVAARGGWQSLVHPEDLARMQRHALTVAGGTPDVCECRFVGRDGATRWIRDYATPVRDPSTGRVARIYGAAQDITARKEAQAERERLQASLAQSDRLASMGMMAASVAHEINNPLSYVLYNVEGLAEDLPHLGESMRRCYEVVNSRLGAAELAEVLGGEHEAFDPRVIEDLVARLREALDGARRIKQIVRGLGTFSRADSSELGPVNVQSAIDHALSMAFHEIKYRARVVKDLKPVPAVLATDGKLVQVFLNLFLNAAHAIPEGHVDENEIRVRTWAEGDRVCAEVSDTGTGIPLELQSRIFEPFVTTKGVGAGTGLGLSICRNIVTGLGGEIGFSSEPGRGTRFWLRIPAVPPGWGRGRPEVERARASAPAVRGRILVIDDEAGIRGALERMLGRDHEVLTSASGEEARELLTRDRGFDLIFCDLMMPRVSGMELHAWLAEVDPSLAEQVVFITGGAFTPGAAEYLARTKNLRVEKPFEVASLRRLAQELVLAAKSRRRG